MASITLLSDFGLQGASAGAVKGILLNTIPSATIIDISHEVNPHDIAQSAYLLRSAYENFPARSAHLVLVDTYSEALPKLILSMHNGHYFLAPDNGIIPLALNTVPENSWLCFELTKEKSFGDWLQAAADTIKLLQSQGPADAGMTPHILKATQGNVPTPQGSIVTCSVVYIDNFGNVVTDMTADKFISLNENGRFTLRFMQVNEITTISGHYNEVRQGENLCRFNRNGHLEICVNKGSAASLFGFRTGNKRKDIKITFE